VALIKEQLNIPIKLNTMKTVNILFLSYYWLFLSSCNQETGTQRQSRNTWLGERNFWCDCQHHNITWRKFMEKHARWTQQQCRWCRGNQKMMGNMMQVAECKWLWKDSMMNEKTWCNPLMKDWKDDGQYAWKMMHEKGMMRRRLSWSRARDDGYKGRYEGKGMMENMNLNAIEQGHCEWAKAKDIGNIIRKK